MPKGAGYLVLLPSNTTTASRKWYYERGGSGSGHVLPADAIVAEVLLVAQLVIQENVWSFDLWIALHLPNAVIFWESMAMMLPSDFLTTRSNL